MITQAKEPESIKNAAKCLLLEKRLSEEEAVVSYSELENFLCENGQKQYRDVRNSISKTICRHTPGWGHDGDGQHYQTLFYRVADNRFRYIIDKSRDERWEPFTKEAKPLPKDFLYKALVEKMPNDPRDLRELKNKHNYTGGFGSFWEDINVTKIAGILRPFPYFQVQVNDKEASKAFRNEFAGKETDKLKKRRKMYPHKYYSAVADYHKEMKPKTCSIMEQFNGSKEKPDILILYDGQYLPIECKSVKDSNTIEMNSSMMEPPFLFSCVRHANSENATFNGYRYVFGHYDCSHLSVDEIREEKKIEKEIKSRANEELTELNRRLYGKDYDDYGTTTIRPQHSGLNLATDTAKEYHKKTCQDLKNKPALYEPRFNS